ncbi:MAG: class I SAM-dependent methyltransferase, partial [Gemmatimonadetes bacterium]|nr:class I SAM-dependent methyltransferase [Gemmatimonadota bacterium]
SFWESASSCRLNRVEAAHFIETLEQHVGLQLSWRVLDFGCGFGFTTGLIAARVASVSAWDAAANMRTQARDHLAAHGNVELLDLGTAIALPDDADFDLIVVNSVVQYMSADEFVGWLAAWRDGLAVRGRLVLSDLIPREYDVRRDIPAVLLFSLRRRTLLRALVEGVKEWRRYRRVHRSVPLLTIAPEELAQQAGELGLDAEILPANLSSHPARLSVVLTRR